jgi:hypothetical protein
MQQNVRAVVICPRAGKVPKEADVEAVGAIGTDVEHHESEESVNADVQSLTNPVRHMKPLVERNVAVHVTKNATRSIEVPPTYKCSLAANSIRKPEGSRSPKKWNSAARRNRMWDNLGRGSPDNEAYRWKYKMIVDDWLVTRAL